MKIIKKLGIWMDHASAHIIEITANGMKETNIFSEFTHEEKLVVLNKGEKAMHNKEQQQQGAFYNKIAALIKNYEAVILFGPTNAKAELLNILKSDQHFAKIKIEIQETDKMTSNERQLFVKKHFA